MKLHIFQKVKILFLVRFNGCQGNQMGVVHKIMLESCPKQKLSMILNPVGKFACPVKLKHQQNSHFEVFVRILTSKLNIFQACVWDTWVLSAIWYLFGK